MTGTAGEATQENPAEGWRDGPISALQEKIRREGTTTTEEPEKSKTEVREGA